MIVPPKLQNGSKVLIISPSGRVDDSYVKAAIPKIEKWGLKVELSNFCLTCYGRFSATDEQRLEAIQVAFDRTDIDAIFCSRGGYGAVRYVDKINCEQIKKFPKWLVGYSDITTLHALLLNQGICSIHAPMLKHWAFSSEADFSLQKLAQLLFKESVLNYQILPHPLNRFGEVSGRLVGGNLSTLYALRSSYLDAFMEDDLILYLEDVGERAYHLDRMMQNLRLSGVLSKLKGLIIGQFSNCAEDDLMPKTIYQNILELVSSYNYPVCFNFPVGHVDNNLPLLNGGWVDLKISDSGVCLKQFVKE